MGIFPQGGLKGVDRRVVSLLFLVLFTSGADMLIITPILPQLATDLGVRVDRAGLWVTAYAGATATFALIFGPISDRVGRKPVLLLGMGLLALGTGACGFAWSFWSMLGARLLAGMGGGLLMTSTTAYVGDHFEGPHRAIAMGWVMTGFFLSLILSVPLGAALAHAVGWSKMFWVYGGGATIIFVGLVFALPKPRAEHRTATLSLGSAVRSYRAILSNRRALGILLMSASIGMSMTMFMVYASPWLKDVYGFGTGARGLVYTVGGPAVLLGGPLAGRLANRFGRVRMVLVGSLLMGLMQILMPLSAGASAWLATIVDTSGFAKLGDTPWPLILPTLATFFLAMMAGASRSSPFQTLALEVVAAERRGTLSALRNTFNQVGSAVGAAVGGLIWAQTQGDYETICLLAFVLTLAGVGALMALTGSDPRPPTQEGDLPSR